MNQLRNQSKKGAILVFVLALIVFISVLCLRLMEETVQELRHVSQQHRRDDLRVNAYSALDLAVGVLNEFKTIEGALYDPAQGWGDPLSWAEVSPLDPMISWNIKIVDESAKINPKNASRKDMVSLFAQMHSQSGGRVDEDDGEPYYDAWMDWEDADDDERDEGAEDDYYEKFDPPYFTPGKKVMSFEEFRMIKGFFYDEDVNEYMGLFFSKNGSETSNMGNFRSSFSFFNEGPVNINGASSFLKKFLCGDNDSLHEQIVAGPRFGSDSEPYFKNLADPNLAQLQSIRGIKITCNASLFRIIINVSRGKARFKLQAVLMSESSNWNRSGKSKSGNSKQSVRPRSSLNTSLGYPFRVLSIRENENLID
jgi:hypothetical protein